MVRIRRALVSVSDKRGVVALAEALTRHGVELLSTGGTGKLLRGAGVPVMDVASYTGAAEILDGRVKTLHPRIHGGLLGRATDEHRREMAKHDIPAIDLVVVNLYPFVETLAKLDASFGEAIENIDIGGPSMIRSGAKNHERVAVVVDPADYAELVDELDRGDGQLSANTRFRLARKAFVYTAAYDGAIANFFSAIPVEGERVMPPRDALPETLTMQWGKGRPLRYGENPHQRAAFYEDAISPVGPSVAHAEVLQGKELSYNNLVDLDAALQLVCELDRPAAVIVKHTNPCGAAESDRGLALAFRLARACDPVSAFGGVVALNRAVDDALGDALSETFLECIIAPGFSDGARAVLAKKKNLRLLSFDSTAGLTHGAALTLRSVYGGLLAQTRDNKIVAAAEGEVITRRRPTPAELRALDFAWRLAKHVKSNAIVLARNVDGGEVTVGVGAGQMSRVDAVKLAVGKAQSPTAGAVLGSDAFFPFRDGVDAAAAAGVTAIIQPGGSVRDDEVVAAADEHGIAMVLTRMRHFRH